MGGFKKFLWSLMTIVLIVISAILASLALVAAEKVVKTGSSYDNFLDEEDE